MSLSPSAAGASAGKAIDALRSATTHQHHDIENLLALDGAFSQSHYARVMRGFHAFLQSWEPVVAACLPDDLKPWFATRSRRAMAAADLAALGLPAPQPAALALPLPSLAAAFGSLYVLEGSALGGQVLARRLSDRLGLDAARGAAYMNGWGRQTGPMWRDFCERLESVVGSDARARHQAQVAAVLTFDALASTFRDLLHEPARA